MALDRIQVIQMLKMMKSEEKRHYDLAKLPQRKMKPSERAMTLAHYQMNIEALEFAITELEKGNDKPTS